MTTDAYTYIKTIYSSFHIVPTDEAQYSHTTYVDHKKLTYKNNLKIINFKMRVGIDHCHKK